MAKKEVDSKKSEVKCDPVKETAKDVLCALITATENEDDTQAVVRRAYEIAEAFENYKINLD